MASEFFLEIVTKKGGKIKGEAQSSLCPQQIKIERYEIGITSPGNINESGRAMQSGRIQLEEAEFEFVSGASSTPLFQTICTNDPIKTATLSCLKTGLNGKPGIYMQWRFNDARLASFRQVGDDGRQEPREVIRVAYSGIEITYKQQKGDGSAANNMMAAYDAGDNAMTSPTLE
jgi:type VI secretion system Hcp family effector